MPTKPRPLVGYATKTQALTAHLTELALKLGPGARLPTMQQLSIDLGISVMTLNRALSELEAQGVVIRRQGSGTYVGDRVGLRNVGLVYDRDVFAPGSSPFGSLLLREAERRAAESNEKFSLYLAGSSTAGIPVHDDLAEAIRHRRLSGVLFAGESDPAALKWLLRQKIPVVALSYAPVAPHRVRLEHAATAALGAAELARAGCRRIGLWIPAGVGLGPEPGATTFEELDAFRSALRGAKLEYHPELVWNLSHLSSRVPTVPPQSNQRQGYEAAMTTFGPEATAGQAPDGIVILDDTMTAGALSAFNQLEIGPGNGVQIATHTNRGSDLLLGFDDRMVRLEVDPAEVAAAMFGLLEQLMRGDADVPSVVSVKPHVVG